MKIKITFFVFLFFICGCNNLSNDFFYSLFDVSEINPHRVCENNPSMLSEGRFIEIYSLSEEDYKKVISRITTRTLNIPDGKILKYGNFKLIMPWKTTPINQVDSIKMNIYQYIKDEKFECFDAADIIKYMSEDGNYYSFLKDHIGNYKLFVLTKNRKLYLLTSYEM